MTEPDDTQRSLVPFQQHLPSVPAHLGGASILRRMAGGALQIARQHALDSARRHRVRGLDLCEPDYRQVLLWAERLRLGPEVFIGKLAACKSRTLKGELEVIEGRIRTLVWDGIALPLSCFEWLPDLEIRSLAVTGRMPYWPPEQPLSSLRLLAVDDIDLTELDLRPVPGLTNLWCRQNQLTELDLRPVPDLTDLQCEDNSLTKLDLQPVPGLTELWCGENPLAELDLRPVPRLTELYCGRNQLTQLDLRPVPDLTQLMCDQNELTELDLRPVQDLTHLWCNQNQLTELDLRPVPRLLDLDCSGNQLTELDLTPLLGLTNLQCDDNPLSKLDLCPNPGLTWTTTKLSRLTILDPLRPRDLSIFHPDKPGRKSL